MNQASPGDVGLGPAGMAGLHGGTVSAGPHLKGGH
jgi:hypothetical protein